MRKFSAECESIPRHLKSAFAGLGLVMEGLAHMIKDESARECALPVELTALEVGPGEHGREMVSIDISEYGDPLVSRTIRTPFSVYWKPWQQPWLFEPETLEAMRPFFFIPVRGNPLGEQLQTMRNIEATQKLAEETATFIPEQSVGMEHLVESYLGSEVRRFHDWYYSHIPHPAEMWAQTYDFFPLDAVPACVRLVLTQPNDLLLRPWGMRLVVRTLLALGWHPRHIAGLITSKFARDHGWADLWTNYDPAMRADFYTRLFAGLFMVRHDDMVDFNCQSTKEEKGCPVTDCPANLAHFRQSALTRRNYGYMAHRPFNRLISSHQHL
ncbi:MAG: hypothetical protein ABIT76_00400 [Chthoniobacterales bacterium]